MVEVALIGDPVAHSLSPLIQSAAFAALEMDWRYSVLRVEEGELERTWPDLGARFRGVNVTSPHKRAAARLADTLSPTAKLCASVNTITFSPNGAFGDSTDGAGFLAALGEAVPELPQRAVLLGTGGAARAVAAALLIRGVQVLVVGRNQAQGRSLEEDLAGAGSGAVTYLGEGAAVMSAAMAGGGLLVNATLLGGPLHPDLSPVPDQVHIGTDMTVFDLVYWPRPTPLQRRGLAQGCRVIDGLEMLVEQGALSFQAWTGFEPPRAAMREAAQRAVEVTV